MGNSTISISYENIALLGIAFLVLVSLITLYRYFFQQPNPLVDNTEARIEAGQNPANLMNSYRQYERRRRIGCVMVIAAVLAIFAVLAPEAFAEVVRAVRDGIVTIVNVVMESARDLSKQLSSF